MFPLFRAVVVWAVILTAVVLPRADSQAAKSATVAVTQVSSFDRLSVVQQTRTERVQAAQMAQVQAWSAELQQGLATYKAQEEAARAAEAQAAEMAALSNHQAPQADIARIIHDAFAPLGQRALQWAMNVAYCESRYNPNAVNSSSGASGLFQFMPATWAGSPWASKSVFDPVANAQAAAWLYQRSGPGQWSCTG